MNDGEWAEFRRWYLGVHNIYLPDTPEIRAKYENEAITEEGGGSASLPIEEVMANTYSEPEPEPEVAPEITQIHVPRRENPSTLLDTPKSDPISRMRERMRRYNVS